MDFTRNDKKRFTTYIINNKPAKNHDIPIIIMDDAIYTGINMLAKMDDNNIKVPPKYCLQPWIVFLATINLLKMQKY